MKRSFIDLLLAIVIAFLPGTSVRCHAGSICTPQGCTQTVHTYDKSGPKPFVNPSIPHVPAGAESPHWYRKPLPCGTQPAPLLCRSVPQKVRTCTAPESACGSKLVPLYFDDPGPVRPIVQHVVGLVGATVALPFRVAEILCPLPWQDCAPVTAVPCGPVPVPPTTLSDCYPIPQRACRMPPACLAPVVCAPCGPAVAPLPPALCLPPCAPNVPPALVEEYQFPQVEPQNLLSGIWNLPGNIIRSGRFAGDIHNAHPCAPPICR